MFELGLENWLMGWLLCVGPEGGGESPGGSYKEPFVGTVLDDSC